MDKLIEYINFESSNKYTLVVSSSNSNSRPVTRGTSKQNSPRDNKNNPNVGSTRSMNEMESAEAVDHVLTKVLTDDEAMIVELRNAAQSRNSLRSKQLEKLEETKANLNEIKSKVAKKLLSSSSGEEQEFPEDTAVEGPLSRSGSSKRDLSSARVKAASDAILNRVASSKGPRTS